MAEKLGFTDNVKLFDFKLGRWQCQIIIAAVEDGNGKVHGYVGILPGSKKMTGWKWRFFVTHVAYT